MSGFKMSISQDDIDLKVVIADSGVVGDRILKKCGTIIKVKVVGCLNTIRTKSSANPHLADDVVIRQPTDKYGYKTVKVGGGKRTGTLWHIVNDGTYRSKPTHFMDNAISQSQSEIQQIIDTELKRVFK